MKSLVFFAILIACANAVKLNQLKGGVCPGSAINQTIFDHLTFVKNITNAVLYQQQDIQPPLNVIHLYGTPYEMGFAHGAIMKDVVTDLYPQVFDWIDQQVKQAMKGYPEWLQKIIEEYGVTGALEATFLMTRAYTPDHFLEELQGFADGSGIDYNTVIQLHMLPELTQAACSMSGAWGPASSTNTLYQLRALDWSIDGPFQQFPSVIVYHPNSDNGHSFAILAWAGFIAALTGMSSEPVGVCEKVWDGYTGELSRSGYPWHYLLRDILQYDQDIDDALSRIATATRTCAIFVGLGDPVNGFRAVEYAHTNVTVYDDRNFPNWPNHFRKTGLVYVDKHVQPSADQCIGTVLQQFYGQIDATTYINYVTPMHQTGDMHIGVYDYQNLLMYVSNASPWINGTCTPAYQRPFIRLDLNQLFAFTQN